MGCFGGFGVWDSKFQVRVCKRKLRITYMRIFNFNNRISEYELIYLHRQRPINIPFCIVV